MVRSTPTGNGKQMYVYGLCYESLKIRVFKQFCKTTIIRYVLKNAEMGNKCMPMQ